MTLRFLVVEGNSREARLVYKGGLGLMPCEAYAAALQEIEPAAVCDLAFPADEGANNPDAGGLAGYDGIFITGSALNIYDRTPESLRQIDFMGAIYASQTPTFGSCWGLQLATVAAGGDVQANANGREIGFARRIVPTEAGRTHPMLGGRPATYDAPATHLDAVTALPPDCTVLAANAYSIQAAEIRCEGGSFWGVQYHPEYTLKELATILDRRKDVLVREGFCRTHADATTYVADLIALDRDPSRGDLAWRHGLDAEVLDPVLRRRELRNFIEHRVKPEKSARGRA
jgi:GMP synthase (glutamine-hydrolysing)